MSMIQMGNASCGKFDFLDNNLTVISANSTYNTVFCTEPATSGKLYCEVTVHNIPTHGRIGISTSNGSLNSSFALGNNANEYAITFDAYKTNSQKFIGYGTSLKQNDVVGIMLDLDNYELSFSINGVNYGKAYDIQISSYYIGVSFYNTGYKCTLNFGNSEFKYPIPEGYKPYDEPTYYLIESENKFYTIIKNDNNGYILEMLLDISLSNISDETFKTKGFKSLNYVNAINIKENLSNYKIYKERSL